jgi:transglutaminase-like putative cysteine protease
MDNDSSRRWDWIAAGVFFAAMLVAAGRLLATNWIPHLAYVWVLVSLGVILGMALGKSLFSRRVAVWLAIGYSLFFIPWQLSYATEDALDWGERLSSLGGRLIYSLAQLSSRQPVDDFILFLTFVCILFWIISVFSGYALIRHGNILAAVLPAGLAIIILHTYDWAVLGRIWYLGIYLFLSLFLYGRINFINSSLDWKQRRIFITPEANLDISVAILISAGVLILLAWTMPISLSSSSTATRVWNSLVSPWDNLKQRFKDAFAALQGTVAVGPRDFYSDNLSLGLGNPLGDTVLFTVKVPQAARELPRLYWRGRVYDRYEKGNWTTTAKSNEKFDPDSDTLNPTESTSDPEGTFYFTTYIPNQSLLYLMPDLLWISRAGEFKTFSSPDKTQVDMVLMRMARSIKAGETFSARSRLANPTILQLRQAGEEYPEWVAERYLQLPDDFSPRIKDLALEITNEAETPYDKANAITNYLRNEIVYTERIEAPPPNTDLLEWFLFETKKGFCNYYASAEVLMLRSVGVPARLAVGYAQGRPNRNGPGINVLQKDAHAWVEVYFPGAGWVEFEPTASQSPINRPEGGLENSADSGLGPLFPEDQQNIDQTGGRGPDDEPVAIARKADYNGTISWVIIVLLAITAGILVWRNQNKLPSAYQAPVVIMAFLERRHLPVPIFLLNWARWVELSPIAKAFSTVNQSLRWLGNPQPPSATPAERAEKLRELMPEAGEEIDSLTAEHQTALYSSRDGNLPVARQASQNIRYMTIKRLIKRFFS